MPRYLLCYSKGYKHLMERFRELMEALGLDPIVLDEPAQRPLDELITDEIEKADGVVLLYGPPEKPRGDVYDLKGAEFPFAEFNRADTLRKPIAVMLHRGTTVPLIMQRHQTATSFNFWDPADILANMGKIISDLLQLKQKVESNLKSKQNSGFAVSNGAPGLVPSFLDLDATLSHEVRAKFKELWDMRRKLIDTKFLFMDAESYKFYEELRKSPQYTFAKEGEVIFTKNSTAISRKLASLVGKSRLTVVALGIGFGKKERVLLHGLRQEGVDLSFLVIDINPGFAQKSLKSMCDILDKCASASVILGDFDRIDKYAALLPNDGPVLFLALGGVFGNQNESDLLDNLREVTRGRGDAYLLMDLLTEDPSSKDDDVHSGYDSEANKRFIQSVVSKVEHVAIEDIRAVHYVDQPEMRHLRLSAVPSAKPIVMECRTKQGHKHYVGYSTRYIYEGLYNFLVEEGCEVFDPFTDPNDSKTLLLLCKLKSEAGHAR
jgi:hypothetical protein